jgi:Raf kinase inhibitor-like YbhB/YbcL family protein
VRFVPVVILALIVAGCGADRDDGVTPSPSPEFAITVTSRAFTDGGTIPAAHTCGGAAPPISWSGVPAAAKSLALVVDDPGATHGPFVHWIVYDLAPADGGLVDHHAPAGATVAAHSGGVTGWLPPCPPAGRTHHYRFMVHALDAPVGGASTRDVLLAIDDHTIAVGWLTGLVTGR